jgi:hypothetical protein
MGARPGVPGAACRTVNVGVACDSPYGRGRSNSRANGLRLSSSRPAARGSTGRTVPPPLSPGGRGPPRRPGRPGRGPCPRSRPGRSDPGRRWAGPACRSIPTSGCWWSCAPRSRPHTGGPGCVSGSRSSTPLAHVAAGRVAVPATWASARTCSTSSPDNLHQPCRPLESDTRPAPYGGLRKLPDRAGSRPLRGKARLGVVQRVGLDHLLDPSADVAATGHGGEVVALVSCSSQATTRSWRFDPAGGTSTASIAVVS